MVTGVANVYQPSQVGLRYLCNGFGGNDCRPTFVTVSSANLAKLRDINNGTLRCWGSPIKPGSAQYKGVYRRSDASYVCAIPQDGRYSLDRVATLNLPPTLSATWRVIRTRCVVFKPMADSDVGVTIAESRMLPDGRFTPSTSPHLRLWGAHGSFTRVLVVQR